MDAPKSTTLPDGDGEWLVEDVTRRVAWTTDTAECAGCGSTVRLEAHHYYATARPTRDAAADADPRRFVFCSRSCVREWLES